ncbi:hypothetical protein GEMRC1_006306 [Eukaryota sp. GEM-RC1]
MQTSLDQYYRHQRKGPLQPKKRCRVDTDPSLTTSSIHTDPFDPSVTFLRDVLVSETSPTKLLSSQFNDILSVFDALTSVFVSLGSKPKSLTWDELQSAVQSLLNQQKWILHSKFSGILLLCLLEFSIFLAPIALLFRLLFQLLSGSHTGPAYNNI